MSVTIILSIMILLGIIGGFVNYLMPTNTEPANGNRIRSLGNCLILGIGATILVPLFLEFAQSNLLDDINSQKGPPLKNYFLFSSYCFLAAAAGFRFINNQIENIIKDKKIATLKKEKGEIEKRSTKLEKDIIKVDAHNKLRMDMEEKKAPTFLIAPRIGPITHSDDPQKGRFGGKSENNNRCLKALVKKSSKPNFYSVSIWVESTNPENNPLDKDVTFYIHDSFVPSVYTIHTNEFQNGTALDDQILAYGAFTIGAVTDDGNTLLELDLAEDPSFPEEFRNR